MAFASEAVEQQGGDVLRQQVFFYLGGVVAGQAEFEGKGFDDVLHEAVDGLYREFVVVVENLREFVGGFLRQGLDNLAFHVACGGVGEGDGQDVAGFGAGLQQLAEVGLGEGVGLSASRTGFV